MQTRKTSFVTPLAPDIRRRHEHTRVGKQVTRFIVQIELFWRGQWTPVVRYDTGHGFAHRDRMHPNGKVDKTPIFVHNFNEALTFGEADLRSNWTAYVDAFLKESER